MKGENGVEKIMLQEATTLELVRELTQREGVEVNTVGPSTSIVFKADGPVIVLLVTD
mgnify:CR=1 FL=1